jgi:hypothetical protein
MGTPRPFDDQPVGVNRERGPSHVAVEVNAFEGAVDLQSLREAISLSAEFWGKVFGGMSAAVSRDLGPTEVERLWNVFLSTHQHDKYLDGMQKLGLTEDPPAVAAAKYHYFTNIIGGLAMEYVEESERKVWIRYLSPMWTFGGIAMIAMPRILRRRSFSNWHPRNGIYLGCPELGYVGTKFVTEGDPYDEGYFEQADSPLTAETRMRYEVVTHTPEFDPERAPRLDPDLWPEARILKARSKFSTGYALETVRASETLWGTDVAGRLLADVMSMIALQFLPALRRLAGHPEGGGDVHDIAQFHASLLRSSRSEVTLEFPDAHSARLTTTSFGPFEGDILRRVWAPLGAFSAMSTRILNGRTSFDQRFKDGRLVYDYHDTGRWLW